MPESRDRTGLERLAVHDRGVEFVRPGVREDRALARVEERRVFEERYRRGYGVEALAVALEHVEAGEERFRQFVAVSLLALRRHAASLNRPRAAVHHEPEGPERRVHP